MSMQWKKIAEATDGGFYRGTVFRTNGDKPYEKNVDFMLISDPDSPSGFALIVATGYKAGSILVRLPK